MEKQVCHRPIDGICISLYVHICCGSAKDQQQFIGLTTEKKENDNTQIYSETVYFSSNTCPWIFVYMIQEDSLGEYNIWMRR